ncbi:cytochrome-c peroxidase [Pedobacter frigiditerrae]|uniref:Methylamine utilization protein MauG n=1 Tax=Pedobacter frigiditerrae TaxID=2530452 RepID=A0A4R0MRQ9_9SPHI|nr:cytochrome c peroxidase [Pedobacter frigiditerrae]TCC88714.1 cytochrome-c peroxidase [Pedobacter frigiditerrae]
MKRFIVIFSVIAVFLIGSAFLQEKEYTIAELRELYSGDPAKWPKPDLDQEAKKGFSDIGYLGRPTYPKDNPFSEEKQKLGRTLFFDPRLSSSKQIACASCHDPELGWGDGKRVAYGHDRQNGKRNAMTIINTAFYKKFFWDGRANSLEHQSGFPVADHVEMNMDLKEMVKNVNQVEGYKPLFKLAFGSEEINLDKIQKAIATFERSIVSTNSRFDSFVKGNPKALKDEEVVGLHLFRTKARCINCHNTPLFSDNRFHNDGQALLGSRFEDLGLYNVTKDLRDVGKMRTPSLRETNITGPWMHHGNFPSIKDVIEFYNLGNPIAAQRSLKVADSLKAPKSAMLRKLNLTLEEQQQLEAFLKSISTMVNKINPPVLPK